MTARVVNAQRQLFVSVPKMRRLARCVARRLRLSGRGIMSIVFIGAQRMRSINRQALGHDRVTDVLSFRYDQAPGSRLQPAACSLQPIVGEILIAPSQARAYAKAHGISYDEELARYVVHGLLHWMGQEDRTRAQQARMRRMENELLAHCGVRR